MGKGCGGVKGLTFAHTNSELSRTPEKVEWLLGRRGLDGYTMKPNLGFVLNRAVLTAGSAKSPFPNLMQGHLAKKEKMIQSGLKSKRI